ncbi:hypothetical protein OQA88_11393 [Cercophora sp. LCS_1]
MQIHPGRALCSRWVSKVFSVERCSTPTRLPLFLCPALQRAQYSSVHRPVQSDTPQLREQLVRRIKSHHKFEEAFDEQRAAALADNEFKDNASKTLPAQCSGCGALSQTTVPGQPGYFNLNRKAIREFLGLEEVEQRRETRNYDVVEKALAGVDLSELESKGVNLKTVLPDVGLMRETGPVRVPVCERCHDLLHYNTGDSIFHPSVDSLRETILESPHKYNHVYHVLDAADFPMSLVPRIADFLDAVPLRSHNRRLRNAKFYSNKRTEIHFIITRADLLGPRDKDVDRLLPYLREVLRDALGTSGQFVRLGNVKFVSAKRGWWTKRLRNEIYGRGGAWWMVGKANVGKSSLFASVFPQGKTPGVPNDKSAIDVVEEAIQPDGLSLLPPLQPETPYPDMPLVSSLPGTTASPIRLSFGGGKGEVIDLPGLPRSDLEKYIQPKYRDGLVMRKRVVPEQQTLKPGKSLLLGGFIRITPRTPDLVFLAYNFTRLPEHVTSTEKAIGTQERTDPVNIENISTPAASEKIKLAGSYQLKYNVTKQRAGPLTRKNSVNLPVEKLPFRVLSIDILIEGCGWVEIVAEVRAKRFYEMLSASQPAPTKAPEGFNPKRLELDDLKRELASDEESEAARDAEVQDDAESSAPGEWDNSGPEWPVVDVYTPEGRFVACRRPMNAWVINRGKVEKKSRPRRSMRFAKKTEKKAKRAAMGE